MEDNLSNFKCSNRLDHNLCLAFHVVITTKKITAKMKSIMVSPAIFYKLRQVHWTATQ